MTLLVRTFQSKPGRGQQLIDALQSAATRMIQTRQADSVLLCQQSDAGERILWIENRQGVAHAPRLDEPGDLFEETPTAQPLEFLDGFYRFPMPSCQVWSVEVRTPSNRQFQTVRALLRLARRTSADSNIAGLSLYRAVDDPTLLVAFLALLPGIAPAQYFKAQFGAEPEAWAIERAAVWRPLSVSWTMGRMSSAGGSLLSASQYPSTAFWARSGRSSGQATGHAAQTEQPVGAGGA
ncbi:MAG TPA: hypothetical protein VGV13_11645 [Methylomirabilota bacterium]|jgi:hypothetical protein|nr:hypothetical protein [Methylomirabilota bacterium]